MVVLFVTLDFYYANGARAWTRQALWFMPFVQATCVACREFATCVHPSTAFFAKSRLR